MRNAWKNVRCLLAVLWLGLLVCGPLAAQESVCARVKIEIKQELTLERQAFDAEMRITNSLPATPLTEVNVDVKVTDEMGVPVAITTDPNDLTAKFFLRQTQTQNIENTSGTGQVAAQATAVINWLLIPAPGAAGNTPFGKRYLIGATLRYKFGTETHVMELNPDAITVKPLPSLTLDYFLTRDIIADDPFTTEIEAPEPYTLGVRVLNSGMAAAQELKINSAQPRIVENLQGLPISFVILGGYVQDVPATNSLLINFGDIPPNSAKMGRWQMESNLAGTFVDFSATFTHSDELGGALTSLLQATNAHLLIRDVRVDLPGRDVVRDFLAVEGSIYRLYESEGQDNEVTDRSAEAVLITASGEYQLNLPPTQGFFYVRKPDPFQGQKALGAVLRADAKAMAVENVWLSKTKNRDTQLWEHWFNVFDVNSPGSYNVAFKDLDQVPKAPVLQFIPDRVVKENVQVSFLVEASSPMGKHVTLSADPLPTGATFHDQGDGTGVFDWTPEVGQAGNYLISYLASDGSLSSTRSAKIRVESEAPPAGPAIPQLTAPLDGAHVASLRPSLQALTGEASNDPTQSVEYQLYADLAMTELLGEATVPENQSAGQPTTWQPAEDLNDNTRYYWRARALGTGGINSEWASASFFVNLFNNAPDSFNLTSPTAGADVATETPILSATNATDRDGDEVTYSFEVYSDSALTQRHDGVAELPADISGTTHWTVTIPLTNHATYYWRAIATDVHGAHTATPARTFRVSIGNQAPTLPGISSPAPGSRVSTPNSVWLRATNSTDGNGDALTYRFEVDIVSTFDSTARRASPETPANSSGITSWQATELLDNQRYFWRVKSNDGQSDSEWALSEFLLDAVNEPPSQPTIANPGDRAWVSTQYPTFVVNPSVDPEGDAITYSFEIYRDAAMSSTSVSGNSATASWQSSTALTDKATHYWRARAVDSAGAASEWTTLSAFFVSTQGYVPPTISVISPEVITDARSRVATISWNGTDPNIEPKIALYYDKVGSGYAGTRIVDGLTQDAGTHTGSYVWNMTGLSPGAYYIYGVIYDEKGLSRAYAPGTLVIPADPQTGGTIAGAMPNNPQVKEPSGTAFFAFYLSRAPTSDVSFSVSSNDTTEATASPSNLTFTPTNWRSPQRVTATAVADHEVDGNQPFTITVSKASSNDPNFIGVLGKSMSGTIVDDKLGPPTSVRVSDVITLSRTSSGANYIYKCLVVITNTGAPVQSGTVKLSYIRNHVATVINGIVSFGAIAEGESVTSTETIEFSTKIGLSIAPADFGWEITTQ